MPSANCPPTTPAKSNPISPSLPTPAWRSAYEDELTKAKEGEPEGLSRRSVAVLTRIGDGKPMAKREGAICERISKGRLQLVEELRRAGIRGAE